MKQKRFTDLPPKIITNGYIDETCELTITQEALDALNLNKLKIEVQRKGTGRAISGLKLFIGSTSGNIRLIVGTGNASIKFGENSSGVYELRLVGNSSISIGDRTTSNGVRIICNNSGFLCGEDCMLSDDILIQTSDQHGIVSIATGQIVNSDSTTVVLGDHVWLGRRCVLTPNARVGNGSIIGIGAIVTRDIPEKVIAAGVPARVIKENHTWCRSPFALDDFSRRYIEVAR